MKLLIVSATRAELEPLLKRFQRTDLETFVFRGIQIEFLITGVGVTATAFVLGKRLSTSQYDLALNVGIAGAFDRKLNLGQPVNVIGDFNAEEGAEDGEKFLSVVELGLRAKGDFPFSEGVLKAKYSQQIEQALPFQKVKGITVNKVHGNEASIQEIQDRLQPDIESMEGAAFFYSCLQMDLDCVQIRTISNYVERRNRKLWEVDLALNNLAEEIASFLERIS